MSLLLGPLSTLGGLLLGSIVMSASVVVRTVIFLDGRGLVARIVRIFILVISHGLVVAIRQVWRLAMSLRGASLLVLNYYHMVSILGTMTFKVLVFTCFGGTIFDRHRGLCNFLGKFEYLVRELAHLLWWLGSIYGWARISGLTFLW